MDDQLACTNPECEDQGVAIANPFGYPPAAVVCGTCGTQNMAPYDPPEPQEAP